VTIATLKLENAIMSLYNLNNALLLAHLMLNVFNMELITISLPTANSLFATLNLEHVPLLMTTRPTANNARKIVPLPPNVNLQIVFGMELNTLANAKNHLVTTERPALKTTAIQPLVFVNTTISSLVPTVTLMSIALLGDKLTD